MAMQISMVAIDKYNYQIKPQLPILIEPLLVDFAGQSIGSIKYVPING